MATLAALDVFGRLAALGPLLVGSWPIGVAVEASDIDIACAAADLDAARGLVLRALAPAQPLRAEIVHRRGRDSLVVAARAGGFVIEVFCQDQPARDQHGHRHLRAEHFLLWRHGAALRAEVLARKGRGEATEPAFAAALGIAGADPYEALLDHAAVEAAAAGVAL